MRTEASPIHTRAARRTYNCTPGSFATTHVTQLSKARRRNVVPTLTSCGKNTGVKKWGEMSNTSHPLYYPSAPLFRTSTTKIEQKDEKKRYTDCEGVDRKPAVRGAKLRSFSPLRPTRKAKAQRFRHLSTRQTVPRCPPECKHRTLRPSRITARCGGGPVVSASALTLRKLCQPQRSSRGVAR